MHPIKSILFDLDGVLVNTTFLHYETFRDALQDVVPTYRMSWEEHESRFEGMSTNLKLEHLRKDGIVTEEQCKQIFAKKQERIEKSIPMTVYPRESLRLFLITLNNQGFRLFCCSNSIRKTLDAILTRLGILEFFEATYSNEDVQNPKPSPEIYQLAMRQCFLLKHECLIVEDSQVGRTAAYASGAHVLEVEDAEDLTPELLREQLYAIEKKGSVFPRTLRQGYPFVVEILLRLEHIPLESLPIVIESFIPNHIPQEHYSLRYHILSSEKETPRNNEIDKIFWDLPRNLSYTYSKSQADLLPTLNPIVLVTQQPPVSWSCDSFYKCLLNPSYDGVVVTKYQPNPHSSKDTTITLDEDGHVTSIVANQWISPSTALGIYGWRRGGPFAEDVVSGFTQAIKEGHSIRSLLYKGI